MNNALYTSENKKYREHTEYIHGIAFKNGAAGGRQKQAAPKAGPFECFGAALRSN
ncbi:hypothetical protein [Ruminococcus sp. HUN007]|uniref:hypothetical protein n=1 Tax=Ruminococcus sp. HUN007 TaxID=1514668 RepID=UPI000B28977F|nr:hypothetical protein [Ruminococcus sp. HUN007]